MEHVSKSHYNEGSHNEERNETSCNLFMIVTLAENLMLFQ